MVAWTCWSRSPPSCRCRRLPRLIGVPQEDRAQLIEWADATLDHDDRDLGGSSAAAAEAAAAMFAYGDELIARRREDPGEDLLSAAVHGTVEDAGERRALRHDELQLLFSLLVAAGTETTRNTIAVGVAELARHPSALGGARGRPGAWCPSPSRSCCAGRRRRPTTDGRRPGTSRSATS